MTIVVPFDANFAPAAIRLLNWCVELSGRQRHPCVLVCSKDTPPAVRQEVFNAAQEAFASVVIINPYQTDKHQWPQTVNLFFRTTCAYMEKVKKESFFWCEVDCVPLVSNWIDLLEAEYYIANKPYMGFRRDIPVPHISGPAIYPHNVRRYNSESLRDIRNRFGVLSFDLVEGKQTLKHAHVTKQIHHEWGAKDAPWTFPDKESLKRINQEAVVFHRSKSGDLIERLRENMPKRVAAFDPAYSLVGTEKIVWATETAGETVECYYGMAPKDPGLRVVVLYIYPVFGGKHDFLAKRFTDSYTRHFPEVAHKLVVVANGGEPTPVMRETFANINCDWIVHDDTGWDIGAYRKAARVIPCEMMVFMGGTAFVLGRGWLERMIEAFKKHGPEHIYGSTASHGGTSHIRTTGWWCDPKLLNSYPFPPTTSDQGSRYEFEHGKTSFTNWVLKRGGKALMVTWTQEVEKEGWDLIPNGFHRGDQSALIVGDRLTEPPYHSAPTK